jgi:hypothetical protein
MKAKHFLCALRREKWRLKNDSFALGIKHPAKQNVGEGKWSSNLAQTFARQIKNPAGPAGFIGNPEAAERRVRPTALSPVW